MTGPSSGIPLPADAVVAVVGAGVMGAGIAQVAAAAGHPVLLTDARPEAAEAGLARIRDGLRKRVEAGKMAAADYEALIGRIRPAHGAEALAGAGLAIEAIFENLAAKQELLREIEAGLRPDAILASNTSSVSITAIGAALRRPERLAGMHFFNPAPAMKLVEVVSGLATDPAVANTIFATAAAWGKTPVHAKSTPGFIVNRIARPFYAEALRLVEEGAAEPALIDLLVTAGGRFPMGPFRLMDLIGNDTNAAVTRSTFEAYFGDPRYRPSLLQGELVAAGRLGRKSGRGFYDYAASEAAPAQRAEAPPSPLVGEIALLGEAGPLQALVERLRTKGHRVASAPKDEGSGLRYGRARLMLTDGRPASLRAAPGEEGLAVLDLADDYGQVADIAFAVQDGAAPEVARDVRALLGGAGVRGRLVDDAPGLVVARMIAMLANEASEAVLASIATAEGVDQAMRHGLNHPRGPFEWIDRFGADYLLKVLDGMAASYGDDRYRASVKLRRAAASRALETT